MLKNPGRANWSVVEMDTLEGVAMKEAADALHEVLERSGFSQETLDVVEFEFGRAEVGRDEPVNVFQITLKGVSLAEGSTVPQQAGEFLLYMRELTRGEIQTESEQGSIFMNYTYSGSQVLTSMNLAESIRTTAKLMFNNPPLTSAPAPAP